MKKPMKFHYYSLYDKDTRNAFMVYSSLTLSEKAPRHLNPAARSVMLAFYAYIIN